MQKHKKLLTLGFVMILLLLAAGAIVAFTQVQETARQEPDQPPLGPRLVDRVRRAHRFQLGRELLDAALADELDISVKDLVSARQAARQTAIQKAADEGLLSEDRAELMLARAALAGYIDRDELIAQVLGLSVAELETAREEGQNLRQLALELGLDGPTIRENLKVTREEIIHRAEAESVITTEQLDLLLKAPAAHPRLPIRPLPGRAGD